MAITLSHGGPTMYRSAAPSRQVLVGTIEGVVRIERDASGSGWHVADRALADKHVHAVLIEPDSGTIFAGMKHGSLFASDDDGQTWERRDKGLTEHNVYSLACARLGGGGTIFAGMNHGSLFVSDDDGQTWERRDKGLTEHNVYSLACARLGAGPRVFAGTEPAHLFYSDDLGRSWSELAALRSVDTSRWSFPAPPNVAHTKHIDFHPQDSGTLFIGIEQGGLLKSTDAGKTFRVIPGMDDDVHRTVINPLNPDRIYITTGIGMYVSSDGGTTWEQWTDLQHEIGGYPDLLVLHPRRPELMFIASAETGPGSWRKSRFAGSRVSKSTDGGRTWQILRAGLPDRLRPAFEAMCLEDWGDSFSIFAATATGEVWCSDDGGDHWSEILTGLAPISKGDHYAAFVTA